MKTVSKLIQLQTALLAAGTVFAWYNVIKNFIRFYGFEGTIFKLKDCIIPNPVTEPCFYGAVGFLVATIWSLTIYKNLTKEKTTKWQHYLWWFISAGTIFAWFNVTKEFVAYYRVHSGPVLGCSATPITNPFLTPCFTGAAIFLICAIISGVIFSRLTKPNLPVS